MAFSTGFLLLVCGISQLLTGAWTVETEEPSFECPEGGASLNNRCFFQVEEARTFMDSESDCQERGGNLASVHDEEEFAVVTDLVKASNSSVNSWIGLRDSDEESGAQWVDESDVEYATSFELTFTEELKCVGTDGVEVIASDCDTAQYYVCAVDMEEE